MASTFGAFSFARFPFSGVPTHTVVTFSGVEATFSLGTATVTGTATVSPDGVQASFGVGTPNLIIWNAVDDSAANTWIFVGPGSED